MSTPARVCPLGTKKHWDQVYAEEQTNFDANNKDFGECWYSDEDAEQKATNFILTHFKVGHIGGVCDLGTGNGHLLFALARSGLKNSSMVGIDYSEASIRFAKEVLQKGGAPLKGIQFFQSNFLLKNDSFLIHHPGKFSLVLDKGTLDAIYLSHDRYEAAQSGVQIYPERVASMMKLGAVLMVTSCNFTAKELIAAVTKSHHFQYWTQLKYPVFEFGGQQGSAICTVMFKCIKV